MGDTSADEVILGIYISKFHLTIRSWIEWNIQGSKIIQPPK
jgi:hypothetical protein